MTKTIVAYRIRAWVGGYKITPPFKSIEDNMSCPIGKKTHGLRYEPSICFVANLVDYESILSLRFNNESFEPERFSTYADTLGRKYISKSNVMCRNVARCKIE